LLSEQHSVVCVFLAMPHEETMPFSIWPFASSIHIDEHRYERLQ